MKNYLSYPFFLTASVAVIMIGLSMFPKGAICGQEIKQINIISDLISNEDLHASLGISSNSEKTTKKTKIAAVAEPQKGGTQENTEAPVAPKINVPDSIVAIEDYSGTERYLVPFFESLKVSDKRTSRISVMGDSFIEGDILTCDLRNMYQKKYSGNGVGFVPMYSQVAKFRQTVGHTSTGWAQHSIVKEGKRDDYVLSKCTFTPAENAIAEFKITKNKNIDDKVTRAIFVYKNENNTKVEVNVNKKGKKAMSIKRGSTLQSLMVKDTISTIQFSVSNTKGFTAYGVYLGEPTGVYVDNYSVRGSSGIAIANINSDLCKELNRIVPTNLIVLQYGLNIVVDNVSNYKYYKNNMIKAVNKVKEAYPNTPIIMLGVPEQSVKKGGGYAPNPSVAILEEIQRDVAKETKVAFWSVNSAMKYYGGMAHFVKSNWASKDFTHINTKGGEKVAQKLFQSLEFYKSEIK